MPRERAPKTPPRKPYLPRVSESSTTPTKRSTSPDMKPAHEPASPAATPSKSTGAGGGTSRRWTNDEYLELFNHVVGHSISFENAVEGRTRNQAYQAWRCVVLPFITNALQNKDGGSAASVPSPSKTQKTAGRKRRIISVDDQSQDETDGIKVHIVPVVKDDIELD